MSIARIKKDFRDLPNDDKIRLVQELWDEIADPGAAFVLSPEQEAELDARYQRYREDPSRAIPLAEVEARYERRK
jgi:putative addiction module component (TIGR02574 family)